MEGQIWFVQVSVAGNKWKETEIRSGIKGQIDNSNENKEQKSEKDSD